MATRRYGISVGEPRTSVLEATGSATASDNVELTVDLAVVTSKREVLLALQKIRAYILKDTWPPA